MRASRLRSLAVGAVVVLASAAEARAQLDQPLPPPRAPEPAAPKLTKAPAVTKNVEPEYPPEAFAAGLAGDVTLALDLDAAGHVAAATVTRGAGHGFDEAAVAAARQMEFSPAEVDGHPSPIRIELTLHFKPRVVAQYVPPVTLADVPVDAASGLHLVTVWIVVRDDRGGESWVTAQLALDPPTP